MKQKIFTLVLMLAMVFVASSAWAQGTAQNPYPGGTYHYTLGGIQTSVTGTASITFTDFDVDPLVTNASPGSFPMTILTSTASLSFDLTFDMNESDGAKNLRVTVENGTGGCSNYIDLLITVQEPPTIALQITSATDIDCQNLVDPTQDNHDASVGATDNTLTFRITPTPSTGVTTYTYDFHFELNDWTFGGTNLAVTAVSSGLSSPGTISGFDITGATGPVDVTVSFATTTNQPEQDFTATLTLPVLTVGGVDYSANNTITDPISGANVSTITFMPAIGSFTF